MKPKLRPAAHPGQEAPLTDETLHELRRAHHELEAFQLSPSHQANKDRLKTLLRQTEAPPKAPD